MLSDNADPFSFQYVCEVVGLDPAYVRSGIERWCCRRLSQATSRDTATPGPVAARQRLPRPSTLSHRSAGRQPNTLTGAPMTEGVRGPGRTPDTYPSPAVLPGGPLE